MKPANHHIVPSFRQGGIALMTALIAGISSIAVRADDAGPPDLEITLRIRGGASNLADILKSMEAYGNVEIVRAVTVEPKPAKAVAADRVAGARLTHPQPYPAFAPRGLGTVGVPFAYDYRLGRSDRSDFEAGYNQGRRDGRLITELEHQPYRFGPIYQDAMARAETSMKNAAYADAARQYLLAAEQYKGDPISRQRAAHALFATGNYSEALEQLDRAFDLQPKLIYRDYRPSKEFPSDESFAEKLNALMESANGQPAPHGQWALLAYLQFAEGRIHEAGDALSKVPVDGNNLKFVSRLRELTAVAPRHRAGG